MIASGLGWRRAGVLLLGLAAAGGMWAGSLEGQRGPYLLEVTETPDPPTAGADTVAVVVHDAAREPVGGATVAATASLPDMPMPGTPSSATAGGSPGSYQSLVHVLRWIPRGRQPASLKRQLAGPRRALEATRSSAVGAAGMAVATHSACSST